VLFCIVIRYQFHSFKDAAANMICSTVTNWMPAPAHISKAFQEASVILAPDMPNPNFEARK
jgi:hypothetical protein